MWFDASSVLLVWCSLACILFVLSECVHARTNSSACLKRFEHARDSHICTALRCAYFLPNSCSCWWLLTSQIHHRHHRIIRAVLYSTSTTSDHLRRCRCRCLLPFLVLAIIATRRGRQLLLLLLLCLLTRFKARATFDVWLFYVYVCEIGICLSLFYKPPRYGGYINKRRDAETPSLFELNEAVVSTTSNSPQRWSSQLATSNFFSFCLFKKITYLQHMYMISTKLLQTNRFH